MIENENQNKLDYKVNLVGDFPKLRAAILFFINRIPEKLNRISLCKHLYYSDGHYFQKYSKQITEIEYLHIEGSPQPVMFNEVMHTMLVEKDIEITPLLVKEKGSNGPMILLKGMTYKALSKAPDVFSREEMKVLNSMAMLFNGDLSLETRYYPNLYQYYAQTGLYEIITFLPLPDDGKRPHLRWKAWANKIFKLMWQ
ncbi:MAG: Panacea domain-containing protein [Spirochaetia bacterium]|nr:Panacea domain-containing protein [Spirochaetia bacterium]